MTGNAKPSFDEQAVAGQTAALRLMVRALVHDEAAADDVVQETWLTAMQRPPRPESAPGAWLRGIARNVIRHMRRADTRRSHREGEVARPDVAPDSAEVVATIERLRELLAIVSGLPEPIRQAIALRYLDGLMPREIATRLAIPLGTVKTWLNTGLRMLREALDARHGGDRSAWRLALAPLVPPSVTGAAAGAGSLGALALGGILMKAATVIGGLVIVAIIVFMLRPSAGRDGHESAPLGEPASIDASLRASVEKPKVISPRSASDDPPPAEEAPPAAGSARARGWRQRVTIEGKCVAAESGAPLAGAKVTLTGHERSGYDLAWSQLDWRNPPPVTTDADGVFKFRLGLPQFDWAAEREARVDLTIEAQDRVGADGRIEFSELPGGKTLDLGTVALPRGAKPNLRVTDEQGRPVAFVPVHLRRVPDGEVEPPPPVRFGINEVPLRFGAREGRIGCTRADGSFVSGGRLVAGSWSASFFDREGDGTVEFVVEPSNELAPPVTLVRKTTKDLPLPVISGRVVDQNGDPVAGLWLGGFDEDRIGNSEPSSEMETTGRDGTFVLTPTAECKEAVTTVMYARNERHDPWNAFGEYAWGDRNLELVLRASTTLALSVVTAEGAPVTDFAVRCAPAPGVATPGTVRLSGHYPEGRVDLRSLGHGSHDLWVFPFASELAPSDWRRVQVPASGSIDVRVTLDRAVERTVRVTLADGRPVAGTRLVLVFGGDVAFPTGFRSWSAAVEIDRQFPHGPLQVDEGFTNASGELLLRGPRSSGPVWIRALGPGHLRAGLGLPGWNEDRATIELPVIAGCTIRGTVARSPAESERSERPRILVVTPGEAAEMKGPSAEFPPTASPPDNREAPVGPDGRFEISDVPAGVYQLYFVTFDVEGHRLIRPDPLTVVTATPERPAEAPLSSTSR